MSSFQSSNSRSISECDAYVLRLSHSKAVKRFAILKKHVEPLRLCGGALDIVGHHAAPLYRCREWLEATTFDGTPVHSAFEGGWGNPQNSSLETRLWMAAEMGDGRAVQNLVAVGVSVNVANPCNQTALHKAAQSGHENLWCLSMLLSLGADMFVRDISGKTALDYAKELAAEDGPIMPVVLLEQAMDTMRPSWNASSTIAKATRQLLGPSVTESLSGDARERWRDTVRSFPLPLPPASFARVSAQRRTEAAAPTPPPPSEAVLKKRSKKRYGSARERWQKLRDSRRRKRKADVEPEQPAGKRD